MVYLGVSLLPISLWCTICCEQVSFSSSPFYILSLTLSLPPLSTPSPLHSLSSPLPPPLPSPLPLPHYSATSVVGLIPLCENMPSGTAVKPGDVVRAMNGKTIQVLGLPRQPKARVLLTLIDISKTRKHLLASDIMYTRLPALVSCYTAHKEQRSNYFNSEFFCLK